MLTGAAGSERPAGLPRVVAGAWRTVDEVSTDDGCAAQEAIDGEYWRCSRDVRMRGIEDR